MIVVFIGSIGRFPVGGHAWVDLQDPLGLRDLGHEVYYLEDCGPGSYVYDWQTEQLTDDLDYPTAYLRACLQAIGLGDQRWAYRSGDRFVGMTESAVRAICGAADLLVVRGAPVDVWRDEYDLPRRRAFVDSDPGFVQMRAANGHRSFAQTVDRCERLFTVGQRVGRADCAVPTLGRHWVPLLPPVSLREWPFAAENGEAARDFTTVMQWRSYSEVEYGGRRYGNKDREFGRFLAVPQCVDRPFRIALTGSDGKSLRAHGWHVDVGWQASLTTDSYRRFVQRSRAEFAVAKEGYVATRGGWFSDRSVCYLASGRPVLVQDTGLADWLPLGEGVLAFRDPDEAVAGVRAIDRDYERHRRAARQLAEDLFAADKVVARLLEHATD